MPNETHELLFLVASKFLDLDSEQKLKVGLKLGLVSVGAFMYSPKHLEESVFAAAYKQNKIAALVKEIEHIKNEISK